MKKTVLDCMGGDHAPEETVKGGLAALDVNPDLHLIMTGREEEIKPLLTDHLSRITVIDSREVITFDDPPLDSVRTKKDSSLVRGFDALCESEDVRGIVSAGNTGAILAGAFLKAGRIKGVSRPAMAAVLPVLKENAGDRSGVVLCDCGANAECKPLNLLHFAIMADAYFKIRTGRKDCRVALLSNGTEDGKGTPLSLEAFKLIKKSGLNFVGNMEARDILSGDYDVVVSDGFTGNVALKSLEGAGLAMFSLLRENMERGGLKTRLGALMMKDALRNVKHTMDVNEKGGAVFLGVNKIVIKIHGSSRAGSVTAAILQACGLADLDMVGAIGESLLRYGASDVC